MMRYAVFVLLIIIALPGRSQGTEDGDSLRVLQEVRVIDSRLAQFASGDKVSAVLPRTIGTAAADRLASLLTRYSAVNVRSYGPSGLSTASLRGTGGNHTAVFWEGINLQSAMNGGLDLTLVPISFVDDVALQFGGAGSLFGSGTLGGAIHLSSDPPGGGQGWQGRAHQQAGSFGQRYTGLNVGYQTEKSNTQVRWFDQRADYDYPFFNRYTQREDHRRNAGIDQHGVLVEQTWQPDTAHRLSAKYWYQDNLVRVPEVAAARGESEATQTDIFHRAVVRWRYQQARQTWQSRLAFLSHRLAYDNRTNIQSDDRAVSWIAEGEHTYYLSGEHWLHSGINHTYETATVDNYARSVARHRTALFASYRAQPWPALEVTVGARETLIDGNWSPFLPSLSAGYQLHPAWLLKLKAARSYRVPTFNDLYWAGGGGRGNPDLQPETGWSTEVGVKVAVPRPQQTAASTELTIFSNSVDQWINWIPVAGNVWTPVNVEQVWARGVELSTSVRHRFNAQLSARWWGNYTYTKSTKERIEGGGAPAELHKQLIYTPYHQANASLTVDYRRFTFGYSLVFVGEQFTTTSNRRMLPAYLVSDGSASYRWPLHPQHQLLLSAQMNNLLDHAYDVRQGYPMPGRAYQVSLTYQFNQ